MVNIQLRSHGFTVTAGIREHVEKRMNAALGRLTERIRRVEITLTDINGPRRGVDKTALVRVATEAGPDMVCGALDSDLYRLIDRASDRAGMLLRRHVLRGKPVRRGRGASPRIFALSAQQEASA